MAVYRVLFNGYGTNRAIYAEQEIRIDTPHNWSRSKAESENVLFLVHKKLHEHFSKYDILLIEKIS